MNNQPKFSTQDRQRKIDVMASDIFVRMVAAGQDVQTEQRHLAVRARKAAENFYAEDLPSPSVEIQK